MIRALRKYIALSLSEKLLFFETYFISFYVRILIKFFSMKKYSKQLGEENKIVEKFDIENVEGLKSFVINVRRVSRYSFWRTKCFEEAFALKKILKKRGYASTIYFGVLKEENDKLKAHAWLKIGNVVLIGGKGHKKYTITKFFT